MQEVAREAVRDYVEKSSRRELLDDVLDEDLPHCRLTTVAQIAAVLIEGTGQRR